MGLPLALILMDQLALEVVGGKEDLVLDLLRFPHFNIRKMGKTANRAAKAQWLFLGHEAYEAFCIAAKAFDGDFFQGYS